MRLKNISKIEECPYCKNNFGYYQKAFVKGWIQDFTLFEREKYSAERLKYNYNMYDSLNYGKYNPTCYCSECHEPIGTSPY